MMLAAQDLAFGYRDVPIGRNLALMVDRAEVLCLLGPNGCGKTTLFKTLLGLIPPLDGKVELFGRPLRTWSRAELARSIAYVPQASNAFFPFDVIDIVLMGRASRVGLFASPAAADHAAAQRALDMLGVGHLRRRRFTEISGGERQMVLIARALAQEPSLIIMDEPTASLDFGNEARVLDRIRRLRDSDIAIVLSTHNPGHAFACADRVALMSRGKIVALGQPNHVLTSTALRELYGVDVAVAWVQEAGRQICAPKFDTLEEETNS